MRKFVSLKKKFLTNNTNIMTTKTICRERQNYVSPVLEVLDFKAEGVLCSSIEDATEDDWGIID